MQHKNEKEVRLDFLFVHKGKFEKTLYTVFKTYGLHAHFVMEILLTNIDFFFTQ